MDFFSHLLIGILVSIFLLNSFSREFLIYASIMAFLPDFDTFLESFKSIRKSKLLSHKGVSHSFFAAFIVSAISGGVFFLLTGKSFFLAWMIGFLFYSFHVILDFFTASKIPLLYPFSKKRFRFFIDRAINLFLAIISIVFFLTYIIAYLLLPELIFYYLAFSFLIFYLVYLTYKIATKIWLKIRLPKNHRYIPGILPFVYFIYENHNSETKLSFKLTKKFQIISKILKIIESEIEINSEEMEFYNKAKSLSEKYIFFWKWDAIIPMIWKDEDEKKITVLLFLAESFASGRAYSLEVVFDRNSKEVIHESDGFGNVIPNN